MRGREPIIPERRRRVPPQFSWVDHRLVRDGYIQERSASALALYLFLVTVADADGLSWYSEAALCRQLSFGVEQLGQARSELQRAMLIAYRKPLYQVLDLSAACLSEYARRQVPRTAGLAPVVVSSGSSLNNEAVSAGDVLRSILSAGSGGAR